MSYIKWILDTEDEIDVYDLLGEIYIIGDEGRIGDRCTYIDVFFEARIRGIKRMEKGKVIEVDPFVEPDDIIFDYTGNHLVINYGKQKTIIKDRDQLAQDLRQAVQELLEVIDNTPVKPGERKLEFTKLRDFTKLDL